MTPVFVEDRYSDACAPGRVIGSAAPDGTVRHGKDLERGLSIDNHALRIRRLLEPGWGRAGILYGPFARRNGLTVMIHVLNGHNASHTGDIIDTFTGRIKQWLRGSYAYSRKHRLLRWATVGNKRRFLGQLRYWYRFRHKAHHADQMGLNLALGWFADQTAPGTTPSGAINTHYGSPPTGNLLFIRSSGPENGELQVQACRGLLASAARLQNIPLYVMVVLRATGAAYYAATLEGVPALSRYPTLQPLAIDPLAAHTPVYGGLFQSVLGQIGFRVDTRVFGTKIALVEEFDRWYGSAHAADGLTGRGALDGCAAEIGGAWTVHQGRISRTEAGAQAASPHALATLTPAAPSGLIHVLVAFPRGTTANIGLIWRYRDGRNHFRAIVSAECCRIQAIVDGKIEQEWMCDDATVRVGTETSIQLVDRGATFQLVLNGEAVWPQAIQCAFLESERGIGLQFDRAPAGLVARSFEAHPRTVQVPAALKLNALKPKQGRRTVILDDFRGKSGALDDSSTSVGGRVWRKFLGDGRFVLCADECVVVASIEQPNPGRTAYTVPWDAPDFADVSVDIRPPGAMRGQGARGRAGVIFCQDPDNYIIISTWLDDNEVGASISSFFQINGFEDVYDAVWTNIGSRVRYGVPYQLSVTFDGLVYTAYVDNEPVLYRSLRDVYHDCTRLQIRQVGIVANWEWGNDTGSAFRRFEVRH